MESIKISGDMSLTVEFENNISPEINDKVRALNITLLKKQINGVIETVPTYRSLTIYYDIKKIKYKELKEEIIDLLKHIEKMDSPPQTVIEIPVLYGGAYGPDLEFVAKHNNISVEEVIRIHSSGEYLIYMMGFMIGFPYLGGMKKEIKAPRLENPRLKISAGSVGIAGEQTGIYPIDSPGGWRLIGKTPLVLYDPKRENPILLKAGQYIKFQPITAIEYSLAVARLQ